MVDLPCIDSEHEKSKEKTKIVRRTTNRNKQKTIFFHWLLAGMLHDFKLIPFLIG